MLYGGSDKNPFIYNVPNFNKGNSPGDIRKNKLG